VRGRKGTEVQGEDGHQEGPGSEPQGQERGPDWSEAPKEPLGPAQGHQGRAPGGQKRSLIRLHTEEEEKARQPTNPTKLADYKFQHCRWPCILQTRECWTDFRNMQWLAITA
jgi:hypothetical protein